MSSYGKQLRLHHKDNNPNEVHQERQASTYILPPPLSKVQECEQALRRTHEKAAQLEHAFQADLDNLRVVQRNAYAELETKVQMAEKEAEQTREAERQAEEEVKQAMEHLQKCHENLNAVKAANKETVEHFLKCRDDLHAMKIRNMEAVSAQEERIRSLHSQAAARIQRFDEMLDEARQEEMTRDASSAGEAA